MKNFKKKQDKFKNLFELIDITNKSLNEVINYSKRFFGGLTDSKNITYSNCDSANKDAWNLFSSFDCKDLKSLIRDFVNSSKSNANGKDYQNKAAFIQIGVLFSSLIYQVSNLEEMMKGVIDYNNNFSKERVNLAKFGPSSMLKINQKINN